MAIGADEKYVLMTTYRRDGRPVSTPVWWVELGDGSFGFWTSSASGKAKRLAHTARVTVQPCNSAASSNPARSPIEATARVVSGAELETIRRRVVAKYGVWTKVAKFLAKLGGVAEAQAVSLRGPRRDRHVLMSARASAPGTSYSMFQCCAKPRIATTISRA